MKVQMICSDLDGTLLNSKGMISKQTIASLRRASQKKIKIVLASGRHYESLVYFSDEILQIPTYKISFNGALINSVHGVLVAEHIISNQTIMSVIKIAKKYQILVNFSTATKWINFIPNKEKNGDIDKYNETLTDIQINSLNQFQNLCQNQNIKILKVGMHIRDENLFKTVYLELEKLALNVFQADAEFLEATTYGVSKYTALKKLEDKLGIAMDQKVDFGDYENDYEMISKITYGVAMSNGMPRVKQVAKFVTDSNDNDGVAHVINRLLTNQGVLDEFA